ncbi:MAG: hypothetical protein ACQETH_14900 [Candidatus Rifleibacteriota bacterium]
MRKYLFLLAMVLFMAFVSADLHAYISATADRTDVTVRVDGEDQSFTVLQDYKDKKQFYYVPNRPRLATRGTGSKKRPVFHLLKYQTKDENTNKLVDGGVMQFAIQLTPEGGTVDKIRKGVADQFKLNESDVKLSPLPFKNAEVSIYDLEGNLLKTEFQKPGIAPSFANNEIPFQVQLTKLSTDVYDALTTGGGGIPVYITYTFDQISEPSGFEVEVDWNQTYKHFSEDKKTKSAYTRWYYYRTWWGRWRRRGKTGVNETKSQTLSEVLRENKSIDVKRMPSEDFPEEEINKYLDPILERINKEIVEKMTPPEKVDPAVTKEPSNPGYWNRRSSNMAVKKVDKVKEGKETIKFESRHAFETKSTYGTILGIGQYSDKVKDELITIKPAGNWNYSYFSVPAVGNDSSLGIKKIDLQVVPRYYPDGDKDKKPQQIPNTTAELVTWTPENGYFADKKGNEITNILFPMQSITNELEKEGVNLSDCCYEVIIRVTQDSDILEFNNYQEFLMGGVPVTTPMARIEGVVIDCSFLEFATPQNREGLAGVTIKIDSEYPDKTYNTMITARSQNKTPVFLVEKQDQGKKNPVIANIMFRPVGERPVPWEHNGENLQNDDLGLYQFLWGI